jgi:hypothetical protein
MFTDLGNTLDPSWFGLAMLVPVALIVVWYGNQSLRKYWTANRLEPGGRPFFTDERNKDVEFEKQRLRLEQQPATAIAGAPDGILRIEGRIIASAGTLGGQPGRECVWRNKVGGLRNSAVASDAIVVADRTGKAGVEGLEAARVIAPHDKHSVHHESMGLYIGDKIEVIGRFAPDLLGEDDDPTQNVYGTMASQVIRVLDRPTPQAAAAHEADDDSSQPDASPTSNPAPPQPEAP